MVVSRIDGGDQCKPLGQVGTDQPIMQGIGWWLERAGRTKQEPVSQLPFQRVIDKVLCNFAFVPILLLGSSLVKTLAARNMYSALLVDS